MTLISQSQELIVLEPIHAPADIPLEVMEMPHQHADLSPIDVKEPGEIEIVIGNLPGAPDDSPEPEVLEVSEDDDKKEDENKAEEVKVPGKWDWNSRGAKGFVAWVKERFDDVPKHSGQDTAGLNRAQAYLEKLDDEISKAMRMDLDGELDANKIEEIRSKIEHGIASLQDRIDKIKQSKRGKNRKKKADLDPELVKEAQKITGVSGIVVTVPLLISRIARVCINSTISAGKDIERTFADQVKKYKLNDREQAETRQLIDDMGFTMQQDRGLDPEENFDPSSSNNYDYSSMYKA